MQRKDIHPNEVRFLKWLKSFLKKRKLQYSQCGFKTGSTLGSNHKIDLKEGYWQDPNHTGNKPPRWLFNININSDKLYVVNPVKKNHNIGAINSAQGDKAGVIFRILPLVSLEGADFIQNDEFEIHIIFIFPGATPSGSSAEAFSFDTKEGILTFKRKKLDYIFCGLLGLKPRETKMELHENPGIKSITYGEVIDELSREIFSAPMSDTFGSTPVYDLSISTEVDKLTNDIENTWSDDDFLTNVTHQTSESIFEKEEKQKRSENVLENPNLIGVEPVVYSQINMALKSGKKHIILYGPPGTGKTTLAQWIADSISSSHWTLLTGSSDWSSQDLVGGYQPTGGGQVKFVPGVMLRQFDCPLIIDELNRCDIDKVLGPLFSVLSGQTSTLPYRTEIDKEESQHYIILPNAVNVKNFYEFAPGPKWHLIATINTIDRAALYQMSYALSRRFGWIFIDVPKDTNNFIATYLHKLDESKYSMDSKASCPLGKFWDEVNKIRPIGASPIIDTIKMILKVDDSANFFSDPTPNLKNLYLDALEIVYLPLLDGISEQELDQISSIAIESFLLDENNRNRFQTRLKSMVV